MMGKVGRNDPCPCGSGKKYKQCCEKKQDVVFLNEVITQEAIQLQQELFEYALTHYGDALSDFIFRNIQHLPVVAEEEQETFMLYVTQWAIFCAPLLNGRTVVEHYVQTRGSKIKRASTRNLLRSWTKEVPSFARVIAQETNLIVVEDLFTGEQKRVTLQENETIEVGNVVVGVLVSIGATYTFFLSLLELEKERAEFLVERLRRKQTQISAPIREWLATSFPELLHECFMPTLPEDFEIDDLQWDEPIHRQTAHLLKENMDRLHEQEPLTKIALVLWRTYCELVHPTIKKPELYAAALHYLIVATFFPYKVATQKDIAEHYGVSSSSLSAKYREMEEVLADFLQQVYDKLEELDLEDDDWEEEEWEDEPVFFPPQHSRIAMERELRQLERVIEEKDFSSVAEANEYIQKALQKGKKPIASLSPKDEAQELLYQALEEMDRKKRLDLAHRALAIYPNSPDAYNILGDESVALETAMNYYKQGMIAGEKDLGKRFFRENKGHFWGIVETRPYMRAKANYAQALWQLGEKEKAVEQYEQLLQLNPNDNQGVRYLLLPAYIELGKYDEAEELMNQYDEATATMDYNRLLVSYLKYGLHEELEDLLEEAIISNPYVIDYLLKKKRLPKEDPLFFSFGDDTEAVMYAKAHIHLWQKERELLEWLRETTRMQWKK